MARLQGELEQVRNRHFAARDRAHRLIETLGDPGMALEVEACSHRVQELEGGARHLPARHRHNPGDT